MQAGVLLIGLFALVQLFAFDALDDAPRTAAFALWAPLVFATAATVGRSLSSDADRGVLDALLAAPVPHAWHGVSRTLVHVGVLALLAALALVVVGLGFSVPLDRHVLLVFALAVPGLAIIGTVAGGLAAQARSRELLMSILLVPLAAPLVQSGITATLDALAGAVDPVPLLLMAGYDLVAAGAAWMLWPFILEAE